MNDIQKVEFDGTLVLTTQQIAEAYGTEPRVISNNFGRNKDRYVEGKHYIRLEGESLKEFKTNHHFDESSKVNKLYLWTQKGALLHAKSLNTDRAWEAYDRLVDSYFEKKESRIDRSQLSPEIQALYGFLDLWLLKRELFLCKKTLDLWVAISYIITKRQGGDKDVAQNRQTYRWGRTEKQANLIESNRDNCKEISRMCRNHSENSD